MRGIFSKLNISKALLTRGLSLVVVFATLVASYAALTMNKTLGWFAKNETVSANGMITQAYTSTFKVTFLNVTTNESYTGPADILANVKVPGQVVTVDITVQNTGIYSVDLTGIGLEAPQVGEEIPKLYEGDYYYLGTQLNTWLSEVTTSNSKTEVTLKTFNDPVDPKNPPDHSKGAQFLRTGDTSGRINYMDWVTSGAITLEPQDSVTFTVVLHFKDDGKVQNAYKNFGEDGSKCARSLFITYDE